MFSNKICFVERTKKTAIIVSYIVLISECFPAVAEEAVNPI